MKKHIVQIRLEVESDAPPQHIANFFQEVIIDSEKDTQCVSMIEIVVDGAFLV